MKNMKNRLLKFSKHEQFSGGNHYHVLYVKSKVHGKFRSIKEADLVSLRLQCMGVVVRYIIEPMDQS